MTEVRFTYKPRITVFLFSGLFFVGCALVLAHIARTNDRGLVLNRIIEFSEEGASIFYWSLAAASGVFVVLATMALYSSLTLKREVILTEDRITAPKSGMSKKLVAIRFAEITDVNIQSVQSQKFLNIVHEGGKLTIPQSMLPNKEVFEELTGLVTEKVNGE